MGIAIHVLGKPKSWRTNWPKWMPSMTLATLSWQRAKSRVSLQSFQASFGFNPDTFKHVGAANPRSVLKVCGSGNQCHEHSDICVGSLYQVWIMSNQKIYTYVYIYINLQSAFCLYPFPISPTPTSGAQVFGSLRSRGQSTVRTLIRHRSG